MAILYFPPRLTEELKITRFPKLGGLKPISQTEGTKAYYAGFGATVTEKRELELQRKEDDELTEEEVDYLEKFETQEGLFSWGWDRLVPYPLSEGMFASERPKTLVELLGKKSEFASALHGDSGGPVFNETGELSGVLEGNTWLENEETKEESLVTTSIDLTYMPLKRFLNNELARKRDTIKFPSKLEMPSGWLIGGVYKSEDGKHSYTVIPSHGDGRQTLVQLVSLNPAGVFQRVEFGECDAVANSTEWECQVEKEARKIRIVDPHTLLLSDKHTVRLKRLLP